MELWQRMCRKCHLAALTRFLIAVSVLAFTSSVYLIRRNYYEGLPLKFEDERYLNQSKDVHIKDTVSGSPKEAKTTTTLLNVNCTKQIAMITPNLHEFAQIKLIKGWFIPENGIPQLKMTCPEQGCNVTVGVIWTNRDFLRDSDGVFVYYKHGWTLNHTLTELSAAGRNDTTLIFYNVESPLMTSFKKTANALYGIDVTYHSHSSLPSPNGYYDPSKPTDEIPVNDWTRNKTHLIAWMASNCGLTSWPRTEFVRNLRKHISVDMYGKCGDLSCPKSKKKECGLMLRKYKFYLSLENSECYEYITEKFWENALIYGIVPVVYGGRRAAYEKFAPPNSFIHVADFSSTKELADYLLELDKNDTKYNEYFLWRRQGHVVFKPSMYYYRNIFCQLTSLLNATETKTKRKVSESAYFNSCRRRPGSKHKSSYKTWKPWK